MARLYGRLVYYRLCCCPGCSNMGLNKKTTRLARRSARAREKKQFKKDVKRWSV